MTKKKAFIDIDKIEAFYDLYGNRYDSSFENFIMIRSTNSVEKCCCLLPTCPKFHKCARGKDSCREKRNKHK